MALSNARISLFRYIRRCLEIFCLLGLLAAATSVRAETYWYGADDASQAGRYTTPTAACWGWGQKAYVVPAQASAPNAQFRVDALSVSEVDPSSEYICQLTIYKRNSLGLPWLPYLVGQTYSVYTAGAACPVSPADDSGYCCPKCQRHECNGSNPISGASGNKYQADTDIAESGSSPLGFTRYYNHFNSDIGELGVNWRHQYQRSVFITDIDTSQPPSALTAKIYRQDGIRIVGTLTSGVWQTEADMLGYQLSPIYSTNTGLAGWTLKTPSDDIETYDAAGRLKLITSPHSEAKQTLAYDTSGRLATVTDQGGRKLSFTYDANNRINTVTDPSGKTVQYAYDGNNNLQTVTYPVVSGNAAQIRSYIYGEASATAGVSRPNYLTGIGDENGARFANFSYDTTGRAISSEHAGSANRTSFTFNGSSTVITDAINSARTYSYTLVQQVPRLSSISQPGGAGCSAASNVVGYDANGNASSKTDFNGIQTTFVYDLTRNLETSRVEGAGTPQARTISTAWHATYRLPIKIAEPNRLTSFTYDASGNLLTKTMQATTDVTGAQGLSPTVSGTAQTWTYTYNANNQVLTVTDPLNHTTTYTYYPSTDTTTPPNYYAGDLATITNAASQVTTFTQYDGNGRPLAITAANGSSIAMTYSPRGWLTGRNVTATGLTESTSYVYDGVGQLTKVTLPDASTISYTYDPAHRLTNVADSIGNSIGYTLDKLGNRLQEQVKDPSGALARQTTRIYDALSRLQQITGNGL